MIIKNRPLKHIKDELKELEEAFEKYWDLVNQANDIAEYLDMGNLIDEALDIEHNFTDRIKELKQEIEDEVNE